MRIYDLTTSDGKLRAFEVESTLLSRNQACRLVESIPGVFIMRRSRLFRDTDDFCEFTLNGETFVIEEPWGDNSRYWVGAKAEPSTASLLLVRQAFERYNTWKATLRFAIVASFIVLGFILCSRFIEYVEQDDCLDHGGRWNLSARTCESFQK